MLFELRFPRYFQLRFAGGLVQSGRHDGDAEMLRRLVTGALEIRLAGCRLIVYLSQSGTA